MTPITLSEMTDSEIEAAVAEHVAGWKWRIDHGLKKNWLTDSTHPIFEAMPIGREPTYWPDTGSRFNYLTDANAVLKLLEKFSPVRIGFNKGQWFVSFACDTMPYPVTDSAASAPTFCRAACLALLRSVPGLCKGEQ